MRYMRELVEYVELTRDGAGEPTAFTYEDPDYLDGNPTSRPVTPQELVMLLAAEAKERESRALARLEYLIDELETGYESWGKLSTNKKWETVKELVAATSILARKTTSKFDSELREGNSKGRKQQQVEVAVLIEGQEPNGKTELD